MKYVSFRGTGHSIFAYAPKSDNNQCPSKETQWEYSIGHNMGFAPADEGDFEMVCE